jgi:hypothetical protein
MRKMGVAGRSRWELVLPCWLASFVIFVAVVVDVVGMDGERARLNRSKISPGPDRTLLPPAPSTVMVGAADNHIPGPYICALRSSLLTR